MSTKKIMKSGLKVVFIFVLIFGSNILVKANTLSNPKILAIGSYSSENNWENSILKGFESNNNNNKYILKYEFLDSKVSESKEYDDSFINFLNVKYRDANIDYIIALDDESFKLIRSNLFNEELFTYKKKIIFVGVNEAINLSEDEGNYITGILEYQDNLPIVNTILTAGKNINDIYLILDNSIYCDTVKQEFTKIVDMAEKSLNIILSKIQALIL